VDDELEKAALMLGFILGETPILFDSSRPASGTRATGSESAKAEVWSSWARAEELRFSIASASVASSSSLSYSWL